MIRNTISKFMRELQDDTFFLVMKPTSVVFLLLATFFWGCSLGVIIPFWEVLEEKPEGAWRFLLGAPEFWRLLATHVGWSALAGLFVRYIWRSWWQFKLRKCNSSKVGDE